MMTFITISSIFVANTSLAIVFMVDGQVGLAVVSMLAAAISGIAVRHVITRY